MTTDASTLAPTIAFAVVDVDCGVDAGVVDRACQAATIQARADLSKPPPYGWGVQYTVRRASASDLLPGEWPVYLREVPDAPGALGYHDRDAHGHPVTNIFPALLEDFARDFAGVLTHECAEAAVNPELSRISMVPLANGHLPMEEVADPVEASSYPVKLPTGEEVLVSAFVTPNYFEPTDDPSIPFAVGSNLSQRSPEPGGYQIEYNPQTGEVTQNVNGSMRSYRAKLAAFGLGRGKRAAARLLAAKTPTQPAPAESRQWYTGIVDVYHGDADNIRHGGKTLEQAISEAKTDGIGFLILKDGQGLQYVDPRAADWAYAATRAGMRIAVYYFGTGSADGRRQAQECLSDLRNLLGERFLKVRLVLDLERNPNGVSMTVDNAKLFADEWHRLTGEWPMLYANTSTLGDIRDPGPLGSCDLWVAYYGDPGPDGPKLGHQWPRGWLLWQYMGAESSAGEWPRDAATFPRSCAGLGKVDRSAFRGTADQLAAIWDAKPSP